MSYRRTHPSWPGSTFVQRRPDGWCPNGSFFVHHLALESPLILHCEIETRNDDTAPIDRLSVLQLDGDMYESTIQALDALYHKVSTGGFVIVDDYFLRPCAQAVDDFRAQHGIDAPLMPIDGRAIWWMVDHDPR
jgi:hypothetical protein